MEYRKCFVPTCCNNSNNSPNKIFVRIREDLRKKWCRDVGVEYCKVYTMYCCEDHFDPKMDLKNYYQHKFMNQEPRLKPTAFLCYIAPNKSEDSTKLTKRLLQHATTCKPVKRKYGDIKIPSTSSYSTILVKMEKDTINYMKYKMGFSQKILLADDAVPTKFYCQEDRKKRLSDDGPSRKVFLKKQRNDLVTECLRRQSASQSHTESLQNDDMIQEISEPKVLPKTQDKETVSDPIIPVEKSVQVTTKLEEDVENYRYWITMKVRPKLKSRLPHSLDVADADPSVTEEDNDADASDTPVESNVNQINHLEEDVENYRYWITMKVRPKLKSRLPHSLDVADADPSVTEEDNDADASDTPVESNVNQINHLEEDVENYRYWITMKVRPKLKSRLPHSLDVADADPSVTEEDNDADASDTPVESNVNQINHMCRVCLALDVKMYDLRNNELKTMFQNITGIMFNENNYSVLGSLCWECAARLKAAATFRSKALLSDSLLQDLITSGEQIRKNDITALKENALSQGLISANTLTVIDVFHIVDIEDQNNTTQLLQSGDDGEQTSLSERFIVKEIKEEYPEMDVEDDDNIAIKTEIETDPTSPNTEKENGTNIKEERPLDIQSSSEDTVKSAYCSLLMDMGLSGEINSKDNCENDINKTVLRKSIIKGINEENTEMEIEDDNNVAIKTEIEDDPTSPNEERNTEGENTQISSSSHDKINTACSSLRLYSQSMLRSDILRSPQEDCDTEKTVTVNTTSKSDLISRTGSQQFTEPTNPTKRSNDTSNDHTYYLKSDKLDIKRRNRKK